MSMVLPPSSQGVVHEPIPDDREPKTRRKLLFFDRAKLLLLLVIYLLFSMSLKHTDVPIMPWGDVIRDQLRAKSWLLVIMALEVLRQVHHLISERNTRYHMFWTKKVWGRWEGFWSKRNPWLRYRLGRLFRVVMWIALAMFFFSWLWNMSITEAFAAAPQRLLYNPFGSNGFPWFFQVFMTLGFAVMQFVAIFWFMSRGGVDTYMPDEIRTRFADVWGQDKVLEKVRENIVFLDKPEEIESRGGHVPSGILLWGPPGTGKTLMAEAVAGETGRPYVFVDPGAFQNMFMGVGILKVKSLFRKLRKLSLRHGGVIVFFDEADSLGSRGGQVAGVKAPSTLDQSVFGGCNGGHFLSPTTRALLAGDSQTPGGGSEVVEAQRRPLMNRIIMGGMGGGGGMGTIQALLTELSGLRKPRGFWSRRVRGFLCMPPKQPPKYRIMMMMATNLPDALDPALLRPGRIDRQYHVDYPNLEGRVRTFQGYFAKVRHEVTPDQITRLATITPWGTGALIKDVVNEALVVAIRKGRDFVTWPDVLEARTFKTHGLSDGPAATTLEQWETAVHEGGHAVGTFLLRKRFEIDIATIEQRGPIGGFVSWVPREERSFSWKSDWENDMVVSMMSLAAERHFFGGMNSAGVGGDMRSATLIAERMLQRAAMGDTLASPMSNMLSTGAGQGSDTRNEFDRRVEAKLQEQYQRAVELVAANEWFVMAIAHALVARQTITGDDVQAIWDGGRGPVLDGGWYHVPANRVAIWRFHEKAVRAHDDQIVGFAEPIPPLTELVPIVASFPPPISGPVA
jgi:cell division protease FtsH